MVSFQLESTGCRQTRSLFPKASTRSRWCWVSLALHTFCRPTRALGLCRSPWEEQWKTSSSSWWFSSQFLWLSWWECSICTRTTSEPSTTMPLQRECKTSVNCWINTDQKMVKYLSKTSVALRLFNSRLSVPPGSKRVSKRYFGPSLACRKWNQWSLTSTTSSLRILAMFCTGCTTSSWWLSCWICSLPCSTAPFRKLRYVYIATLLFPTD